VQFPGCAGLPTITVETLRACREIDLLLSAHTLYATTAALSLVGRNLEKRHDASDRETGAAPEPHSGLLAVAARSIGSPRTPPAHPPPVDPNG